MPKGPEDPNRYHDYLINSAGVEPTGRACLAGNTRLGKACRSGQATWVRSMANRYYPLTSASSFCLAIPRTPSYAS